MRVVEGEGEGRRSHPFTPPLIHISGYAPGASVDCYLMLTIVNENLFSPFMQTLPHWVTCKK